MCFLALAAWLCRLSHDADMRERERERVVHAATYKKEDTYFIYHSQATNEMFVILSHQIYV